ncbi:MAG: tRNA 2-thiouridine(34) synthase MnmA [Armatimonadota bacterium]
MNQSADNRRIKLSLPTLQAWAGGNNPDLDIAVLMSGGVDSSVCAMLLKEAGYNVLGITMNIPTARNCDYRRSCCGVEAGYVCKDLGIAHYYLDVRDAFRELVIEPFQRAYLRGETPSPCVDCNTLFKFSLVWDLIDETFGIKKLATGHYARVVYIDGEARLMRAADSGKDQSYFLYGVPLERLERLMLPLGDLTKDEVRKLAHEAKLPVARRAESMELCFAGEGDYRNALAGTTSDNGPILDSLGNVIGEHSGIANFTIGQRKGIGIATGKPLYVTGILPEHNAIRVGSWAEALEREVRVRELNVLIPEQIYAGACLYGKIRSQSEPYVCEVVNIEEKSLCMMFDEPQFAPAPGQRMVLYDGNGYVVAGGTIE